MAPTPGQYFARLKLGNTCFPTSQAASVISINEYVLDRLKIVPNPTYGTIEIISLSNTSKSYELKISNLSGQVLFSKTKIATTKYDREKIDISLFPKGVYIVERKDHNKTLSKRLIKL